MSILRLSRIAVLAVAFALAALVATPAFAADPITTWSGQVPAPGAVLTAPVSQFKVDAACTTRLVASSRVVKIDGVTKASSCFAGSTPTGGLYRASVYSPGFMQSDGQHTVSVTLGNTVGAPATCSWDYTVAIPPVLGTPSPANGAVVASTATEIKIPASDNGVIANVSATVSGVEAPAVLVGGVVHVYPAGGLANDNIYTVAVTVTDLVGKAATKTWSFEVQTYPDMDSAAIQDCESCHPANGDPAHSMNTSCDECHGAGPHPGRPTQLHSRADVSDCAGCHVSSVTVEHNRRGMSCSECHGPSAPELVAAAIASSNSECAACHSDAATVHEAVHTTTVTSACADSGCHSGTSLTSIHGSCASCHTSVDPRVTDAIVGHDKSCTACHDGAAPHGDVDAIHTATITTGYVQALSSHMGPAPRGLTVECSECHATTNLLKIHGGTWNNCSLCHASDGPRSSFTAWDKGCQQAECHAGSLHDDANADANHQSVAAWGSPYCGYCHVEAPSGGLDYYSAPDCTSPCHTTPSPPQGDSTAPVSAVGNPAAFFKSPAQVQITATDAGSGVAGIYHRVGSGDWTFSLGDSAIVTAANDDPGPVEFYAVDRLGNVEAAQSYVVVFDDTAPATIASSGHATNVVWYLDAADTGSGVAATYYSFDGAPYAEYGYFQRLEGIRSSPYGGPHTLSFYSVDVAGNIEVGQTVDFVIPDAPPVSTLSSTIGSSISISAQDDYANAPSGVKEINYRINGSEWVTTTYPTDPFVMQIRVADVAFPGDGTYQLEYYAVDQSNCAESVRSATVTVDRTPPTILGVPDTLVGENLNVTASDPVGIASIDYKVDSYNWVHVSGSSASIYLPLYGATSRNYTVTVIATDRAGNVSTIGPKTVVVTPMPDSSPPTTYVYYPVSSSMDPNGRTYTLPTGQMTLRLASWDGAGVASRHYRIDNGAWQSVAGSSSNISVSGFGTHTLSYYGVDNFGNVESAKTISFTIQAPSLTLRFEMQNTRYVDGSIMWDNENYDYDVTVRRQSDNSIVYSGSLSTWDANGPLAEKSITFPGAGGGPYQVEMVVHTKFYGDQVSEWTGIDGTANETVDIGGSYDDHVPGLDTTPPVTTSNAATSYVGPATIEFTGSDAVTYVDTTWYTLDGGDPVEGSEVQVPAPAQGAESHTITFWSVDADGNVEAAQSATFDVSAL